jgi:hypothetical protein
MGDIRALWIHCDGVMHLRFRGRRLVTWKSCRLKCRVVVAMVVEPLVRGLELEINFQVESSLRIEPTMFHPS